MALDEDGIEINRFHSQLDSLNTRLQHGDNLVQLHDSATFLLKKISDLFNHLEDNKPDAIQKRVKLLKLIENTKRLIKGIEYQNFCSNRLCPVSVDMDDLEQRSMSHLQSSVSDLKLVFHELSYMVKEQDPTLDSIESQVERANHDSQHGRQQLQSAEKSLYNRRWFIAKVAAASFATILVGFLIF